MSDSLVPEFGIGQQEALTMRHFMENFSQGPPNPNP
jgi:hypothetical protein